MYLMRAIVIAFNPKHSRISSAISGLSETTRIISNAVILLSVVTLLFWFGGYICYSTDTACFNLLSTVYYSCISPGNPPSSKLMPPLIVSRILQSKSHCDNSVIMWLMRLELVNDTTASYPKMYVGREAIALLIKLGCLALKCIASKHL